MPNFRAISAGLNNLRAEIAQRLGVGAADSLDIHVLQAEFDDPDQGRQVITGLRPPPPPEPEVGSGELTVLEIDVQGQALSTRRFLLMITS